MTDVNEIFPPIDYTDICDVVQRIRMLNWAATLNSVRQTPAIKGWLSHDELDSFLPFIEALNKQVREFEDDKAKEVARRLITETERVYAALQIGGIRTPPVDEVLKRYIAGDIGENTAKIVLDLDSRQLRDALQTHGLPTMQDSNPEQEDTVDFSFLKKPN
ncbi:hypothetical protein [Brucella tritici]|uniref:Uncharacterized protein n=1 Tax=Brucella tritici TaxID=94626 RepID=A0A6L3Y6Z9_9HYPH|nr:hypothetical protein [Brucella tritici]KAB2678069.1 hypothetical protein F9L08_24415 [Brucella tritici]